MTAANPYESAVAETLFNLIAERIDREGVGDALDPGYMAAIREGRPWCVGVSLGIIAELGWKFEVTIETDDHRVPARVDLAAVLVEAVAERKARIA